MNGHHNHKILTASLIKYLGETRVNRWLMYDLGTFPACVPANDAFSIAGEVYEVDNLDDMDYLESYPEFYNRVEIDTEFGTAWIYYVECASGKIIVDGKWKL